MARKSRWQQFTDNFNGVYDTFNKLGQNLESQRVMGDKFTEEGGAGYGLSGTDLERARYKALGDIYTKYGNAKEGLAVRTDLARLEAADRENNINQQILGELIFQRGAGASGLLRGQTASAYGSANASNASAANNYSLIDDRNATRPLRLEELGLRNQGLRIGNDQAAFNLGVEVDTRDATVRTREGNADAAVGAGRSAQSNARVAEATEPDRITTTRAGADRAVAEAGLAGTQADVAAATRDSTVGSTNSTNNLTTATNERAISSMGAEDRIIAEVMAAGHPTEEAALTDLQTRIRASGMPLAQQQALLKTVQSIGLEKLANDGAMFTQAGMNALAKGLDAGLAWYDQQDDGNTLRLERNPNGTVSVIEQRGDAVRTLFSASGPNADAEITTQLGTLIKSPFNAMSAVAAIADVRKTNAQTSLVDRQAFTELLNQDSERARTMLLNAQVDKTRLDIQNSNLTDTDRVAAEGLNSLMRSAEYIMLGGEENGRALQAELRADFMRATNMRGAPPAGVPMALWENLSAEQKADKPPAGVPAARWYAMSDADKQLFRTQR